LLLLLAVTVAVRSSSQLLLLLLLLLLPLPDHRWVLLLLQLTVSLIIFGNSQKCDPVTSHTNTQST
jgi:hypothetical protein